MVRPSRDKWDAPGGDGADVNGANGGAGAALGDAAAAALGGGQQQGQGPALTSADKFAPSAMLAFSFNTIQNITSFAFYK